LVIIKNAEQIEGIKKSCRVVRDLLNYLHEYIKPGITTLEIDTIAHDYILKHNAIPNFLNYNGFPKSICTSVNDEVVHGIPSKRILHSGDIIGIDCGVILNGYHSDAARTIRVGQVSEEVDRLVVVTEECFYKGIEQIKAGARIGDISYAIQRHAEDNGYSVVRELTGHGVGLDLHEDPSIPNYGKPGFGLRLSEGMTLAIEPMINLGERYVYQEENNWTIRTEDGKPSAHYENTIVVLSDGVEILSL